MRVERGRRNNKNMNGRREEKKNFEKGGKTWVEINIYTGRAIGINGEILVFSSSLGEFWFFF
jgi:hypothetical protein